MTLLSYRLEPSPRAPHSARRAIERELGGSIDADSLDSLMLIVSELVTNSVVHGPGTPVRVELELASDGSLHGEVADDGDGVVEIREEASDTGPNGRGLRIVDILSTRWGVYEGSTHVWFELAP